MFAMLPLPLLQFPGGVPAEFSKQNGAQVPVLPEVSATDNVCDVGALPEKVMSHVPEVVFSAPVVMAPKDSAAEQPSLTVTLEAIVPVTATMPAAEAGAEPVKPAVDAIPRLRVKTNGTQA